MRAFQQVLAFFFALFVFVFAQDTESYDATVYITSTVYRVNTVTMSGTPTASANTTAAPTQPSYPTGGNANVTSILPTGNPSVTVPNNPEFTGAASQLNINALVAVLAVGAGYLAL